MKPPVLSDARLDWRSAGKFGMNIDRDELYEGVVWRRVVAYLIDVMIMLVVFAALWFVVFLSFGILSGLMVLAPLVPLCYHSLMIAGPRSATLGMQFMSLEVRGQAGQRPELLQAFVMVALFYLSVAFTSWLILIAALFNDRRHCVHDYLSGTVVIRTDDGE
ncbi:MAG: RDD family protein [Alphaproteobacteria bacterium]